MIRDSSLPLLTKSSLVKPKKSKKLFGSLTEDKSKIIIESEALRLKLIEKPHEYKRDPSEEEEPE